MADEGHTDFDYAMHQCDVHDLALDHPGRYDLIVSNGVLEHVTDLKGLLNAFRPLLRPRGPAGRPHGAGHDAVRAHPGRRGRPVSTRPAERGPGRPRVLRAPRAVLVPRGRGGSEADGRWVWAVARPRGRSGGRKALSTPLRS